MKKFRFLFLLLLTFALLYPGFSYGDDSPPIEEVMNIRISLMLDKFSGDNQVLFPGETSEPLTVQVINFNGMGVAGATIKFEQSENNPQGASLLNRTLITDEEGKASTRLKVGNNVGEYIVKAIPQDPEVERTTSPWPFVAFRLTVTNLPEITEIAPTQGTVGSIVTIYGENFRSEQYDNRQVLFDSISANVKTWTDSKLEVEVPDVGPGAVIVKVRVSGKESNKKTFTVLRQPPKITSIKPEGGTVGSIVTIQVKHLSEIYKENKVFFDNTQAQIVYLDPPKLEVKVPDVGPGRVGVTVKVNDKVSNTISFTIYRQPGKFEEVFITAVPGIYRCNNASVEVEMGAPDKFQSFCTFKKDDKAIYGNIEILKGGVGLACGPILDFGVVITMSVIDPKDLYITILYKLDPNNKWKRSFRTRGSPKVYFSPDRTIAIIDSCRGGLEEEYYIGVYNLFPEYKRLRLLGSFPICYGWEAKITEDNKILIDFKKANMRDVTIDIE
jgi:hypothetical protein